MTKNLNLWKKWTTKIKNYWKKHSDAELEKILEKKEKELTEKLIKQLELVNNKTIKIEENEEYLVFGSFLVVEKFLTLIGYDANS